MKKEIMIARTFDASRERVWKAWTDAKELAQWWGPSGVTIPISEVDLRVGGALYIVMLAGKEMGPLAGQKWPMKGVFKEIVELEKLVFSSDALDETGNVLLSGKTTVTFEDEGGKTKLTVIASATGDAPGTEFMLQGMKPGWNQQLDKLGKVLA
ncbi:MAG: SRPBCC domain-containing protein [Candidatus Pacebacteria bacterium]|nr:SRPBCC domain-containing protein [Candidatus Paceibacterota bacterium]